MGLVEGSGQLSVGCTRGLQFLGAVFEARRPARLFKQTGGKKTTAARTAAKKGTTKKTPRKRTA
ncbi:hypothetical protein [Streptomyces sp. TRM68367]|uniref:hypothetical protein n=1 Tax=Streptomyces sp. TRM68367 TaxID=2758415 RepID=UPI00165C39BC|nr:hypothetical protein [Streptomyces sp. TRM68367]MBC9725286.1 hypothetical protein [Streptomyces sp. TRM68367]